MVSVGGSAWVTGNLQRNGVAVPRAGRGGWSQPSSPLQRRSARNGRIVLRRLAAVEHAVVADGAHRAMAQLAIPIRGRPVSSLIGVAPGGQEQQLSRVVDALIDVVVDQPPPP